jgi:hypothetical protein
LIASQCGHGWRSSGEPHWLQNFAVAGLRLEQKRQDVLGIVGP